MADQELSLQEFIKQQISAIDKVIEDEETAFEQRNKAHFNKIAALREKQLPFKKMLSDFEKAKKGVAVNPLSNHGGARVKKV